MENFFQRFREVVTVVEDGMDSDLERKNGLAECGDMDRQLAQVALAKFGDIPIGLLEEIFQNMCFSNLLGVRLVSFVLFRF